MANNLKYTLQKHKGKIWLSGSILATAVVGTGIWLVVSDSSPFSNENENISYLASHVITSNEVGEVHLLAVDTNKMVNRLALPEKEKYLFQPTADHTGVYAYDGESLQVIKEAGGELAPELLASGLPVVKDATAFAFSGTQLAVYAEATNTVTVLDIERQSIINTIVEEEAVVELLVSNGFTYYITESEMMRVNKKDVLRAEMGSPLLSLHEEKGKLVIHSKFGNAKGENILFYVNGDTLEIDSLQKTGAPDTVLLSKDDGESHYMAGNYVATDAEPYYLMERYKVEPEGLTKDSLTLKLPIDEAEAKLSAENSVLDHDYIYSHVADSLKVFDVKSQTFVKDVPVQVNFAMPILPEEKRGGGDNE